MNREGRIGSLVRLAIFNKVVRQGLTDRVVFV